MGKFSYAIIGLLIVAGVATAGVASAMSDTAASKPSAKERVQHIAKSPALLESFTPPDIAKPDWYQKQVADEQAAAAKAAQQQGARRQAAGGGRTVAYTVSSRGATSVGLEQFAAQADAILNDARGWTQLGIKFVRVPSGGSFNLILSQPSLVPSFSPGCSAELSCRVGVSVIINDARWVGATAPWNAAGGSITGYRHMVINHEVGHWLGHDHASCPAPGTPAPVMVQQSVNLQGCTFNPWPIASELSAPNLGL